MGKKLRCLKETFPLRLSKIPDKIILNFLALFSLFFGVIGFELLGREFKSPLSLIPLAIGIFCAWWFGKAADKIDHL